MRKVVSDCVDCPSMGLPCIGPACPKRRKQVICCDKCELEETLYHFEGEELCIDCIIERLEVVGDD